MAMRGKLKIACALFALLLLAGGIIAGVHSPEGVLKKALRSYLYLRGVEWHKISTPGFKIAYYEAGMENKQTIILLHGIGGKSGSSWFRILPELSKEYHVIAPDLLLANYVVREKSYYSIEQDERLVLSLMDALEIDQAIMVGLSVGGWIGAEMALDFPDRVEGLVLVDAAAIHIDSLIERMAALGPDSGKWFYENIFYSPPPVPGFLLGKVYKDMNKLFGKLQAGLPGFTPKRKSLETRLGYIRQPTLIVWGRNDKIIPMETGYELEAAIPDTRLKFLDKCGHAVVWDKPMDLGRAISDFAREVDPGSSSPGG